MEKSEVTIVCFGAFGDIINSTPVAKHYKGEGKFVRWITKDSYKEVLLNNQFIDEVKTLKNNDANSVVLSKKFKSAYFAKANEIVLFVAPYMSPKYDGTPRSTLLDILKNETSGIKEWNCDFIPNIKLSQNEILEAKNFLSEIEGDNKILVEFESLSNQSFLNKDLLNELFGKLSGSFILTGKNEPPWFSELGTLYPNNEFYFYSGSFMSNAEIYNNCDLFVGCCSGITCLTSSDYCATANVKRIECCLGPHWSSNTWEHNRSNKKICYNSKQFEKEINKWRENE